MAAGLPVGPVGLLQQYFLSHSHFISPNFADGFMSNGYTSGVCALLSQEQLQSILDALPDRAILITRSGRYVAAFGYTTDYGYSDRNSFVGKSIYDFMSREKADFFVENIHNALSDNKLVIVEFAISTEDVLSIEKNDERSDSLWFSGRIQPLPWLYEGESVVLWVSSDITERHQLEIRLRHLSDTDDLTGVCSRRKLMAALAASFDEFHRYRCSTSVFLFDIDNFKAINDTIGHLAGDEAIKAVAEACKREARKTDLIARLGGDEFIILMEHIDHDQAWQLADRLRKVIAKELATGTAGTISGGVSEMLASDTSMEDVLRRADIALYEAKSQGRNRVL